MVNSFLTEIRGFGDSEISLNSLCPRRQESHQEPSRRVWDLGSFSGRNLRFGWWKPEVSPGETYLIPHKGATLCVVTMRKLVAFV